MTGDLVQREGKFQKLQKPLAFPLDQVLLHSHQPRSGDCTIVCQGGRQDFPRADAAQAGQAACQNFDGNLALRRKLGKLCRDERPQIVEHLRFVRQRYLEGGDMRIFNNQWVEIVQALC